MMGGFQTQRRDFKRPEPNSRVEALGGSLSPRLILFKYETQRFRCRLFLFPSVGLQPQSRQTGVRIAEHGKARRWPSSETRWDRSHLHTSQPPREEHDPSSGLSIHLSVIRPSPLRWAAGPPTPLTGEVAHLTGTSCHFITLMSFRDKWQNTPYFSLLVFPTGWGHSQSSASTAASSRLASTDLMSSLPKSINFLFGKTGRHGRPSTSVSFHPYRVLHSGSQWGVAGACFSFLQVG